MFNFYPFNFLLLFIILIPSVVSKAEKEKEGKDDGDDTNHKSLTQIKKASVWGTMVFFAVKYETIRHNGLISYLVPSVFVLLYIASWLILRKKKTKAAIIIPDVLLSLIYLSSALIDTNYILLLFTLVFMVTSLCMNLKREKENGND